MGSQGRRRGRRTRSDGDRRWRGQPRRGGGPIEWPGLTGPSVLTPEGKIAHIGAVASNLAHARGNRAAVARVLFAMIFPPAGIALLVVMLFRWLRGRPL